MVIRQLIGGFFRNMKKIFVLIITTIMLFKSTNVTFANELVKTSAVLQNPISVNQIDNRTEILKGFLDSYNSPLAPYAGEFIRSADKYSLDWRLVAAISGLESTFGQAIPYNSYNGWGWGIYGNNVIRFKSWPEAIDTISKGLRYNYLKDTAESNPYIIGPSYAASPTWAVRVSYFMQQIEDYRIRNAKSSLTLSI